MLKWRQNRSGVTVDFKNVCLCLCCVFVQLYGGDLESEFSQFQDWLQIFPLYKGRSSVEDDDEDEEERLMGKYKVLWMESCLSVHLSVCYSAVKCSLFHTLHPQGSFLVYPIDQGDEEDTTCQITNGIPKNSPIKVLVRVYIVKVPASLSIYSLSLSITHMNNIL